MEENQTDQSISQTSTSRTDEQDVELKPWIHDLFDIRVIVFLVSTGVIAMTATVLLLSKEDKNGGSDPASQANPAQVDLPTEVGALSNTTGPPLIESKPAEVSESTMEKSEKEGGDKAGFSKLSIRQESDGSFNLSIRSAKVTGCQAKSSGISGWSNEGEVRWDLAIEDRKTGYFRCFITYRSKYEGRLDICLGDRNPVTFYALPQDSDFTEQVMVRLDKPERPTLALIAREIDSNADLIIKRIRLVPR